MSQYTLMMRYVKDTAPLHIIYLHMTLKKKKEDEEELDGASRREKS